MSRDPLRPGLGPFELTPAMEDWFKEREPADPNRRTRDRVLHIYELCTTRRRISYIDGLRRFYAGMRTCCLLAASTACTYIKYIVYGHRLPTRDPVVRSVLRLANLESARADPVRPCRVAPKPVLLRGVARLPPGSVRRAAIIMLATGARCADVAKLQQDEIFLEEDNGEVTTLHVAWSEQKARKSYGCRITIRYPNALIGGVLSTLLREVTGFTGPPCPKVTYSAVNEAMRAVGVNVTSRSFRVCFIEEAYKHLEKEKSGRPVHKLTGHKSDAIPSSAYSRTAVRAHAAKQRARGPARRASPPRAAGKKTRVPARNSTT